MPQPCFSRSMVMPRADRLCVTSAISSAPKPAAATWSTSRAISFGSTAPCGHHQRNPAAVSGPGRRNPRRTPRPVAGRRLPCPALAGAWPATTTPAVTAAAPKSERRRMPVALGVLVWLLHFTHQVSREGRRVRCGRGGAAAAPHVHASQSRCAARSVVRRGCGGSARASRPGRAGRRRAARACTSPLPSAAASAGPASTGTPRASAVSWQSRAFCEPPPTRCTTSTSRPARVAASRMLRR